jgi:hypothetical protein
MSKVEENIRPVPNETISFNKRQRICPKHIMITDEEGKLCICSITQDICNKRNCPQLEDEENETC